MRSSPEKETAPVLEGPEAAQVVESRSTRSDKLTRSGSAGKPPGSTTHAHGVQPLSALLSLEGYEGALLARESEGVLRLRLEAEASYPSSNLRTCRSRGTTGSRCALRETPLGRAQASRARRSPLECARAYRDEVHSLARCAATQAEDQTRAEARVQARRFEAWRSDTEGEGRDLLPYLRSGVPRETSLLEVPLRRLHSVAREGKGGAATSKSRTAQVSRAVGASRRLARRRYPEGKLSPVRSEAGESRVRGACSAWARTGHGIDHLRRGRTRGACAKNAPAGRESNDAKMREANGESQKRQ